MKERFKDPEMHKKWSEAAKKAWENPERRRKQTLALKGRIVSESEKKRVSEGLLRYWSNVTPEDRTQRSERIRQTYIDHPELREARVKQAKERWANPENHIRQSLHMKEIYTSPEGRRKQGKRMKGKVGWSKDLTKETDERVRKNAISISESIQEWWDNATLEEREERARLSAAGQHKYPNSSEQQLIDLFTKLDVPYEYWGDRVYPGLGGKMPDFVHAGLPKIIELFGDYWHEGEDPQIRIDYFRKYDYDCLVVWDHELKDEDSLIRKVLEFG